MLTKEQIDEMPVIDNDREILDITFGDWFAVRDQAEQAIDLAAENELLKAKLAWIKDKAWATGLHSDIAVYRNTIADIYQKCKEEES
jgi:hypothetical protein